MKQTIITEQDRIIFKELSTFLSSFDDYQKKAIISNNKRICCIAGPGSGKTTVLTKRIEFLVKYKKIDPSKILAVTFTRKARQEMHSRLLESNILTNIETFNSFSEKILREYQYKIYNKSVRMIDHTSKLMLFSMILQSLNLKISDVIDIYFKKHYKYFKSKEELSSILINDCYSIIDNFKSNKENLSDLPNDLFNGDNLKLSTILNICKKLQESLKPHGFRMYNDQIIDTMDFFKSNSNLIPRYDYIFVDEYQDLNHLQSEILDYLNPENLFVVGDPRQSIYSWRGSDINLILNFNKKYQDSEQIILKRNYRSNKQLVNFMNLSIKEFSLPDLESLKLREKSIFINNYKKESDELTSIINKVLKLDNYDNIFILARTKKQLKNLSSLMNQKNIEHSIKREDDLLLIEERSIILSTIHSIKGLEADIVFLIGCSEQYFPCKYSDHPILDLIEFNYYDKEKEEKRLFYTAISRAKNQLHLSYSGNKTSFISEEMKNMII